MRRERISSEINLPIMSLEEEGSTPSSLPTSQSLLENMSALSPDHLTSPMPASEVMKVGQSYTISAHQVTKKGYRKSSGMELEVDDKMKPARLSAMFRQTSSKILKSVLNRLELNLLVLIMEVGFSRGEKTSEPLPTTKDPKVFLSAPRMVRNKTLH